MGVAGAIVMGGMQLIGGALQGIQASNAYKDKAAAAAFNAKVADLKARDAIERGEYEAAKVVSKGGQVAAAADAAYVGSGVVVGAGTAGEVAATSRGVAVADARNRLNNAAREALGFRVQAYNFRNESDAAKEQSGWALANGILGGAVQGAGSAYQASGGFSNWG